MSITNYVAKQDVSRHEILQTINTIIQEEDKTVVAEIGLMMGKEMILYKERGHFKYGLSSVRKYMSIHIMPIYGSSVLHEKYKKLLPNAQFQKGCINFNNATDIPKDIIRQLFSDCSKVSIAAMLEQRSRK